MKKTTILAGAVALAGAAYVASSWYVGQQAELAITDAVAQANERSVSMFGPDLSGAQFSIEIRSYQRGLFSSDAQYVIHTVDANGRPMEYIVQDHLQHGPFPPAALSAGELAPMLGYSQAHMVVTPAVAQWFDVQQGQTPLNIETRVGFGGKGRSHWVFTPLESSRADTDVSFSGGALTVDFSDGFSNNVATGHFDFYTLTDRARDDRLEVRDVSLHSTVTKTAQDQFDQDSTVQVSTLTLSGADDASPVTIENLSAGLVSKQQAGLLDARLRYDVQHVRVDGHDMGQITATGSIARLNLNALSELQATYAEMGRKRGPSTEPGFLLTGEEQIILQDKLRPVLGAGPVLSLESLVWKNASGQSRASASVVMRDPGPVENANAFEMVHDLIDSAKLDLTIERSMVVGLFQQAGATENTDPTQAGELGGMLFDEYAQVLTETGLMQLHDDTLSLSLDASPVDDTVNFNGETLTTEQLMMRMMWLLLLPLAS